MPLSNQLEMFKATVKHRKSGGFLFHAGFTKYLEERIRTELNIAIEINMSDYFGMYNPVSIQLQSSKNHTLEERPELQKYYEDVEIPLGSLINHKGVLCVPGSMYHFTHRVSPLRNAKSVKDLEQFPYPHIGEYDEENLKQMVEEAHKNGRVASCWIGHMYEDAWQIRGYEEFLMDMKSEPDMCNYILDKIFEKNIQMATVAAKAGVDVISTGDDVANQNTMMFSPKLWGHFMKRRWAKVYEAARSINPDINIWYHSDGNIMEIIPELIEIGVTILNPVQPECMDVLEVKKRYGEKLVFDGTIGTQSTMPFGTPEEVRKVVRERKELLGQDGAIILSPTHVLEPDVPIENILAFVEECKK